jgi:hypothetical protein
MFLWSIWCLINWYPHTHAVLIYFCVSAPTQYIFRCFPHTFFSSFGSNIKTFIARVQIQRSAVFSQRKIVAKTLKEKICYSVKTTKDQDFLSHMHMRKVIKSIYWTGNHPTNFRPLTLSSLSQVICDFECSVFHSLWCISIQLSCISCNKRLKVIC